MQRATFTGVVLGNRNLGRLRERPRFNSERTMADNNDNDYLLVTASNIIVFFLDLHAESVIYPFLKSYYYVNTKHRDLSKIIFGNRVPAL